MDLIPPNLLPLTTRKAYSLRTLATVDTMRQFLITSSHGLTNDHFSHSQGPCFSITHGKGMETYSKKVMNTFQHQPKTRREAEYSPKTWFDITPSHILTIIATHVANAGQSQDALHLAETSPKTRQAIVTALSKQVTLTDGCTRTNAIRWGRIFNGNVSKLVLDRPEHVTQDQLFFHEEDSIIQMLTLQSLHSARIFNEKKFLVAAAQSRSLRELEVELYDTSHDVLFEALSTLDLSRLSLSCFCEDCPFLNPKYFNQERNVIASSCPNLQSLQIYCECSKYVGLPHPIWRIFPALKNLQEVSVTEDANDEHGQEVVTALQALKSVKINFTSGAFQLAHKVGRSMTELVQRSCLTGNEVKQLSFFANLQVLDVKIPEGSEEQLVHSLQQFSSLRELHLRWAPATNTCSMQYCPGGNCYRTVPSGLLSKLIRGKPNLSNISLLHVTIDINEVTQIMEQIGQTLKVFVTSLLHQHEPVVLRLCKLLETATKCNSALTRFSVDDKGLSEIIGKEKVSRGQRNQQGYEGGNRLLAALRKIRQSIPLLDCMDVSVLVSLFIEDAEQAFI